jgi:hypothetical protein
MNTEASEAGIFIRDRGVLLLLPKYLQKAVYLPLSTEYIRDWGVRLPVHLCSAIGNRSIR